MATRVTLRVTPGSRTHILRAEELSSILEIVFVAIEVISHIEMLKIQKLILNSSEK